MLQVVFGDAEKAALCNAMRFPEDDNPFVCAVGLIHSEDIVLAQQEKDDALAEAQRDFELEYARGKPLGGSPQDAVGFTAALDIGDIRGLAISPARKELLQRMVEANPWDYEPDETASVDVYWETVVNDYQYLIQRAHEGEPVRIWYSDAPYALCGFYSVLHTLKNSNCRVSAVKLPEYRKLPDGTAVSVMGFGELSSGDWASYLPLEYEIPDGIRLHFAGCWEQLQRENAPLRAMINGKLHSVDEDFYDHFLLRLISEQPQTVGNVIGTALGQYELRIGDWFLSGRVQNLIDTEIIKMVHQDNGFYSSMIQKM